MISPARVGNWVAGARWRGVMAAIAAAVLIPAVPGAAAFVAVGAWKIKTETHHGAPRPIVTTFDSPSFASLTVNMGATNRRHAEAEVHAERKFRLTTKQVVELRHAFQTMFRDTEISYKVKIDDAHKLSREFDESRSTRTIAVNETKRKTLRAGKTYKISIWLKYDNEHGFWNNISAHTFSLTAL
jgi:uncharacterized cupredoxin-like copper-binding protein